MQQLLKARLTHDAVAHLEHPWDPDSSAVPNLLSTVADDQLKALSDRFHRPGASASGTIVMALSSSLRLAAAWSAVDPSFLHHASGRTASRCVASVNDVAMRSWTRRATWGRQRWGRRGGERRRRVRRVDGVRGEKNQLSHGRTDAIDSSCYELTVGVDFLGK
jgi:hypothetical protein